MGCGIDFLRSNIFYTLDGKFIGIAFPNIEIPSEENSVLYPTVSMANLNESIRINFNESQVPFKFNIQKYNQDLIKQNIFEQIFQNEV